MDTRTISERRGEVVAKHGPWHAHNIHLRDGVYTIIPAILGDEVKLRRILQCVSDLIGGRLDGLRVLDLGSGEGLYGIEFARHGAQCVLVEGREANIAKARFVKEALALEKLECIQDDVRNLNVAKYGRFDVVLCLGILYHLDAPDLFPFVERLAEVCNRLCVIDTRITLHPDTYYSYRGQVHLGRRGEEHDPGDSRELKASRLKASLDNDWNFWLSRPTLYNTLASSGFTTVCECHIPAEPRKPADRLTFIAIKGEPCHILNNPLMAAAPRGRMPERPLREHGLAFSVVRRASHLLPRRTRRIGRRLLGLEDPLT